MSLPTPTRRSIGTRLTAAFGVTLCLALAGSGYGAWALNRSAERTRQLIDESVLTERLVGDWYRNVVMSVRRTSAIAVSTDPQLADYFAEDVARTTKETNAVQARVATLMNAPEEKAAFDKILALRKGYIGMRDAVSALKKQGDAVGARKMLDEQYAPASVIYQDTLRALSQMERDQIDAAGRAAQAESHAARIALLAFGLGSLVLGGLLSTWLVRGITRPIRRAVDAADRIANLDLTERIAHDGAGDETGRLLGALARMQEALHGLVSQVRASTDSIGTASAEIADGSLDLSSRTE